jgi:hypothetical protein
VGGRKLGSKTRKKCGLLPHWYLLNTRDSTSVMEKILLHREGRFPEGSFSLLPESKTFLIEFSFGQVTVLL